MSRHKPPKIVYKYRDWENIHHRNIIEANELFLSPPKDFNDPFDCRIPTNYLLLNSPGKIQKYIDEYLIRHYEKLIQDNVDLEKHGLFIENRLLNDIADIQQQNEQGLFEAQDKRYGVLSLSKLWNNILMWSHYSNFHRGFCIGFWRKKLDDSRLFGRGGEVIYNRKNDYPEISPLNEQSPIEKSFIETHYKAKEWNYEKEYRLTKFFLFDNPNDNERVVKIEDDCFAELVLGVQMREEHKKEIIFLAKAKNIAVYQAVKVPFKFQIDRVLVK